jgi:hypothetical protein
LKDAETVPLKRLRPNPWNPNVVPEHIMRALVENIREVGFVQPILVRPVEADDMGRDLEVVDGEHRFRAAQDAGLTHTLVISQELSDDDARVQTLALNHLRGEMDPVDTAALVQALEQTKGLPEVARVTGYTAEELQGYVKALERTDWPDPDRYQPKPKTDEPWTKLTVEMPESVYTVVRAELDRLKQLRETEHDHVALEAMAVLSSQTPEESVS